MIYFSFILLINLIWITNANILIFSGMCNEDNVANITIIQDVCYPIQAQLSTDFYSCLPGELIINGNNNNIKTLLYPDTDSPQYSIMFKNINYTNIGVVQYMDPYCQTNATDIPFDIFTNCLVCYINPVNNFYVLRNVIFTFSNISSFITTTSHEYNVITIDEYEYLFSSIGIFAAIIGLSICLIVCIIGVIIFCLWSKRIIFQDRYRPLYDEIAW